MSLGVLIFKLNRVATVPCFVSLELEAVAPGDGALSTTSWPRYEHLFVRIEAHGRGPVAPRAKGFGTGAAGASDGRASVGSFCRKTYL